MRILIGDDHQIVREGLKRVVADRPGLEVAGEAVTGREVLSAVRGRPWDVLVLEIALPDRCGLDVLKQVKALAPHLPVLVFSSCAADRYALRALRAGANGYLEKRSPCSCLLEAIERVAGGGDYLSPEFAQRLALEWVGKNGETGHESLSDREFQVMTLLAGGGAVKDVAEQLCISAKTVSNYRHRLMRKLGLENTTQLIRYALEHDMVE